jgi:hypothetical protein
MQKMSSFKASEKSAPSDNESEDDNDDYFLMFERNLSKSPFTLYPDS